MITLKPNCSTINFKNMEKTKENFTLLMYGAVEKEIIDREIQRNQEVVDGGHDSTGHFQEQLEYLKKLKDNPYYQNGSLPRGIEKISFKLWRATLIGIR